MGIAVVWFWSRVGGFALDLAADPVEPAIETKWLNPPRIASTNIPDQDMQRYIMQVIKQSHETIPDNYEERMEWTRDMLEAKYGTMWHLCEGTGYQVAVNR